MKLHLGRLSKPVRGKQSWFPVGSRQFARTADTIVLDCHTYYHKRMTMMSFRVDDSEAIQAQRWAHELGIDKSELLREALHLHLTRLASEQEVLTWIDNPLTADETAIAQIAEWGPAEDWSDWADATR